MGVVADGDFVFLFNVGEEGTLIIYAEGEDSVLVGDCELCAKDGTVSCCLDGLEVETVERGQHGEFELELVVGRDLEGDESIIAVL